MKSNFVKSPYLFIVLVLIAVALPTYLSSFSNRNSSYDACLRANVTREVLYKFTYDAAEVRYKEAEAADSIEDKNFNLEAAENYEESARRLIDATGTNSPDVDCEAAHPKPFPFDLFD